ncbi:hypothetical protein SVIO_009230 [Streptomyces violaceusniger]|uniref:Uncharacterized protein n=1 Tax=Streptomyces violaceusniger TaxID=68280 RepID=A0A4D4KUQ2_STRVO|nr:hypothetical protein SVIO_009230 [Streptomyces violaceusniger]
MAGRPVAARGSGEPVGVAGGGEVGARVGEDVTLDRAEHAGGRVGDDGAVVPLGGQGDPAQLVQGEDLGTRDVANAVQWGPWATSVTAAATSLAAIGWIGVAGSRTVSLSAVQDMVASMNSMNCVARTIE